MNIESTNEYNKFKVNEGMNRSINGKHVDMICESMKKNGWIGGPIIVNENNDVIDGVHRLEACKKLGLPIYYVKMKSVYEHSPILNSLRVNWCLRDYINFYAAKGNKDYIWLKKIEEKYDHKILREVIYMVCLNQCEGNGYSKIIRSGKAYVKDYKRAEEELEYLSRYCDIARKIGGRWLYFYTAVFFASRKVDWEKLFEVINNACENHELTAQGTTALYLAKFSTLYNKGKKMEDRVWLDVDWLIETK